MPPKKSFAKKVPYSKDRPAKRTKFADDVSKEKVSNTKPSSLPAKVAAKPNSVAKGKQKERAPTPPPNRLSSTKAKSEKQPSTTANIKSTPLSPLPSAFKIVAGSYEKLLYGLEGTVSASSSEDIAFSLKPIFIFPAHVSCVKAVTASPQGGKWLATGSADEIIKVWDLRRRREIGGLMHHEGSVTHLSFPSRSHLLSASEDGTLCLFRARDWSVLRALKGHKGPVNSVAVHPSGKVALSVGKDRTLRMWDLMRGRASGSTKLGVEGELVRWSTSGSLLVVQYQKTIDVYSNDLTRLHTVTHPSRIQDVKFVQRVTSDDEVLLVAAEDKKVTVYDVGADSKIAPKPIAEFVGHENRVKAMDTLRIALPLPSRPSTTILSTVSSDGNIHVYDLFAIPPPPTNGETAGDTEKPSIVPVAIYDSKGSRLTCVTLADGEISGDSMAAGDKRKRSDEEENDGEAEVEWSSEQEDHEEEEEEEEENEEEEEEEEEGEED